MNTQLTALKSRIAADPDARFAISLDRLAYAKDNHRLGSDLVRTYVRSVDRTTLTGQLAKPGKPGIRRTGKARPEDGQGDWSAQVHRGSELVSRW